MHYTRLFTLSILLGIVCLFFPGHTYAVIAKPDPVTYMQPDGSILTIIPRGDEIIHWAETTDGYTLLPDKNKTYVYAVRSTDGSLTFSAIAAHDPGQRGSAESAFLLSVGKKLFYSGSQIAEMKSLLKSSGSMYQPTTGGFPTTGVRAHLMILANFSNTSTTYSQTNFTNLMNQASYNGTGSFKDFYLEVSWGQLTVNSTVTIWVTLPHTHDYYGPQSMWGAFAYDAVAAADQQASVNFATYDNDGDGVVDGIDICHQGRGQEESGNPNDIWSHSWDLSSAGYSLAQRTFDGVAVLDYTTIPEKGGPSSMTTIGVMCHEFGHNLGAPDFYDSDYGTGGQYDGTGAWDIMADGSWNGNPAGSRPAHHNPWTKIFYTWATPTVMTSQQQAVARNIQDYQDIFRYNTTTNNEYFLCQNSQQTGFNAALPGHGMLIFHVDGNYISSHMGANNINATSHQGLYPMAANSNTASGIMPGGSSTINTSGCPWPGTTNKTTFTDATTPNSKSWAGDNTNAPLISIAENNTTKEVTFCFISCAPSVEPGNFTALATGSSQINLAWQPDAGNDPVMVAFSPTGTFGTPAAGTTFTAGDTIPGGGTVIANGTGTSFSHTGLTPNTTYYYKAWSALTGNTYSTGVTANATTWCVSSTLPFSESFSGTAQPACWSQADHKGNGQIWQFGTITGYNPAPNMFGNYAYLNSDAYRSGNSQNADLITPPIDMTGYTNVTLSFNHFFRAQTGSSGTLSYSTDLGVTWTAVQTWTSTTANPEAFSQVINALDGQSQAMIKWNYTGTNGHYWAIDDILIAATPSVPTLSVTPPNQNVAQPAGSTRFLVTSNTTWTAASDQPWCIVPPSGAWTDTLVASFSANPGFVPRVANLTVTVAGLAPVVVTVTQDVGTGIQPATEQGVSLHPNPTGGRFTISFGSRQEGNLLIRVYDHQGRCVKSDIVPGNTQYTGDLTGYPKGEYIVKIVSGSGSESRKLILK
jgi:M6 family metalloprotease-like protein